MRYAKARVAAHGVTPCPPKSPTDSRTFLLPAPAGRIALCAAIAAGGAHAA